MRAILGIDAAWTPTAGSGVALAVEEGDRWRCAGLAPTFAEFEALAEGRDVRWEARVAPVGALDAARLVAASRELAPGMELSAVAVDMPLSRRPITGRRPCDDAVSRQFGGRGCGTHTPSAKRPGPMAAVLRDGFGAMGIPLHTSEGAGPVAPALLEVYPHTALLALTGEAFRVEYKTSKTRTYWPGQSLEARQQRLNKVWLKVLSKLEAHLETGLVLPGPKPFARLKRYEDALDALVCAWVGMEYLAGRSRALGDADAAIWTPTE
jgi:predicted RNase H-like nuclease